MKKIFLRGRRIMANIRAFQACDASSILAARTKKLSQRTAFRSRFLYSRSYGISDFKIAEYTFLASAWFF